MAAPSPRQLLEALFRELAKGGPDRRRADLIAREIVAAEPRLRWVVRAALVHGYLTAARETARAAIRDGASLPTVASPPAVPPLTIPPSTTGSGDVRPPVRFPGIEAAGDWLAKRDIVTADEFKAMDRQAAAAAFTVARLKTVEAVKAVRDAVTEAHQDGGTLRQFREKVKGVVADVFSPAQVETLFRSHVGLAQAAGQRAVLEHAAVVDGFPYRLWSATHDGRVRPEHLAMETHGPGGCAVYRADDKMWDTLWPPCSWNCRCVCLPLDLADAARHGSKEAARWLATGTPPATPVFAARPYPITPPPGWPTHESIVAVV